MEPVSDWYTATVEPGSLGPRWIVVAEDFAPRLLTTHRREFEVVARDTKLGKEQLTRDLPNVEVPESLGDDGLIAVGTAVRPGDILVGKISPRNDGLASPEEKLLRALFGEQADPVWETSLRAPPGTEGVVVEAALESPEKGEVARARVVIEWDQPLAVGDQLALEDGRTVTVCDIRCLPGADVQLEHPAGQVKLAKVRMARDLIHARSIGPYSLVTQQPLGGREAFGGQPIDEIIARALCAGGGRWLLGEMLTIKSDSVLGRTRAYESLVRRENPEVYLPKSPEVDLPGGGKMKDIFSFFESPVDSDGVVEVEVAHVLRAELAALGFDVDWRGGQVEARWMGDDAIRERSHGEVKKPETINYRTFRPEPDGLFCGRIFGPVRDYECSCGKHKRMKDRGVVCEQCGVEVIASKVRRERFGHVELAAPILHPWCAEEVALLLSRTPEEVVEIARGRALIDEQTGGPALEAALARLDLESLDAIEAGPRAELAGDLLERGIPATGLLLRALPVLPPDLRPLVPLSGGRFATSDLNDLYRRVINRNNRTRRLIELDAPEVIIRNEIGQLYEAVVSLFANNRLGRPVRGPNKRPLVSLLDGFESRREGGLLSKRVDYSGAAMVVVDPTLERGCFRLPGEMARELFRPMAYGRLEAEGHVSTIKSAKRAVEEGQDWALEAIEAESHDYPALLISGPRIVARRIRLWDWPAIGVDEATAEALEGPEVAVHIPLTEEARAECARLDDRPEGHPAEVSGWFSAMLKPDGDTPRLLVDAAVRGGVDPLEDEVLRAALGHPPADGQSAPN
jgi:hypothetical protein